MRGKYCGLIFMACLGMSVLARADSLFPQSQLNPPPPAPDVAADSADARTGQWGVRFQGGLGRCNTAYALNTATGPLSSGSSLSAALVGATLLWRPLRHWELGLDADYLYPTLSDRAPAGNYIGSTLPLLCLGLGTTFVFSVPGTAMDLESWISAGASWDSLQGALAAYYNNQGNLVMADGYSGSAFGGKAAFGIDWYLMPGFAAQAQIGYRYAKIPSPATNNINNNGMLQPTGQDNLVLDYSGASFQFGITAWFTGWPEEPKTKKTEKDWLN